MKKIALVLCCLSLFACTAKNRLIEEDGSDTQSYDKVEHHILFRKPTRYVELLSDVNPVAISLSINDFANPFSKAIRKDIFRNFGTNRLSLDTLNEQVICSDDSCVILYDSIQEVYSFKNRHTISLVSGPRKQLLASSYDTVVTVGRVEPIYITNPIFDGCNRIPYCWYNNMEIAWNEMPENENGVLVIAWWSGVKLNTPENPSTSPFSHCVWNMDLVDDIGHAVLKNDLFRGMPEGAIVTLILMRASIVDVTVDGQPIMIEDDASVINDEGISEFLNAYILSDYERIYQFYDYAVASVAKMTFVLVRESYNE